MRVAGFVSKKLLLFPRWVICWRKHKHPPLPPSCVMLRGPQRCKQDIFLDDVFGFQTLHPCGGWLMMMTVQRPDGSFELTRLKHVTDSESPSPDTTEPLCSQRAIVFNVPVFPSMTYEWSEFLTALNIVTRSWWRKQNVKFNGSS